jgi:tRNA/tmRNA/rRNA uracil-C5-methylase (TrmA/RlmC/RlmD family)
MSSTSVTLEIEKLVGGGAGLAHHEGETWLVHGSLPGEVVRAEAASRRAGVVHGRTIEVEDAPHPARSATPCPAHPGCGCDWSHVDPERGAPLKAEVAAEAARTHPEVANRLRVAPVRPSAAGYRLRARLHWDPEAGRLGFYRPRTREVAAATGCRTLSPLLLRALAPLTRGLTAASPERVDVEWLESLDGDAAVVGLACERDGPRRLDAAWVPPAEEIADVVDGASLLTSGTGRGPGWGEDGVLMALPVPLWVPVGAFFQGNRHLVPWLFRRVADLAGPDQVPTWDLHGGVGLLAAAAWSAAPRPLVLAETSRRAARAATRNLPQARVAVGRTAEAALSRARSLPHDALVLLDPPRRGLSRRLRRQLLAWRPRRIISLGCDPATWARDTAELLAAGYALRQLELVDLFPSTHHVEVLALLETG